MSLDKVFVHFQVQKSTCLFDKTYAKYIARVLRQNFANDLRYNANKSYKNSYSKLIVYFCIG